MGWKVSPGAQGRRPAGQVGTEYTGEKQRDVQLSGGQIRPKKNGAKKEPGLGSDQELEAALAWGDLENQMNFQSRIHSQKRPKKNSSFYLWLISRLSKERK